ncbi:MAG TPA: hypothetical protein VH478_04295 [Trebonia sp.]|jgi:hypothetical protein|nr:hypothetical protein [Trebonia sp.]
MGAVAVASPDLLAESAAREQAGRDARVLADVARWGDPAWLEASDVPLGDWVPDPSAFGPRHPGRRQEDHEHHSVAYPCCSARGARGARGGCWCCGRPS